jgi:hypothetical protein
MKKYTATQLHDLPNDVFNEATKSPVLIEHKRRGAEFVLMTSERLKEITDKCHELLLNTDPEDVTFHEHTGDKREGKDAHKKD